MQTTMANPKSLRLSLLALLAISTALFVPRAGAQSGGVGPDGAGSVSRAQQPGAKAAVPEKPTARSDTPQAPASATVGPTRIITVGPASEQSGATDAQKPASSPIMSLDEMLATALKDNPDIAIADAKLREAQATLVRARLDVVQKVITTRNAWETQRALIDASERAVSHASKLGEKGFGSSDELAKLQTGLIRAKGKLAEIEAEAAALLGRQPAELPKSGDSATAFSASVYSLRNVKANDAALTLRELIGDSGSSRISADERANSLVVVAPDSALRAIEALVQQIDRAAAPLAPARPANPWPVSKAMADKLRTALNTKLPFEFEAAPLKDILDFLSDRFDIHFITVQSGTQSGTPFRRGTPEEKERLVTLNLGEVQLGVALSALHDVVGVNFDVKEYGILLSNSMAVFGGGGSAGSFGDGGSLLRCWMDERRAAEKPE